MYFTASRKQDVSHLLIPLRVEIGDSSQEIPFPCYVLFCMLSFHYTCIGVVHTQQNKALAKSVQYRPGHITVTLYKSGVQATLPIIIIIIIIIIISIIIIIIIITVWSQVFYNHILCADGNENIFE